jgi:hypothetical protein
MRSGEFGPSREAWWLWRFSEACSAALTADVTVGDGLLDRPLRPLERSEDRSLPRRRIERRYVHVNTAIAGLLALALSVITAAQERRPPTTRGRTPSASRPAAAPPTNTPPPVEVHTSVSRTAVWVGDRVTYSIELRCAPQVDIVTEDLATERLNVDGLEIRDVAIDRDASEAGRLTYRVIYSLVTFNLDAPALKIGEIPVRYSIRRPGQRPEDPAPPSGEVRIPALTLALRSTLPDTEVPAQIRDGRPLQPLPRRVALAQPVGIGLLVVAAAPVALLLLDLARRASRLRYRGPRRVTRGERRASLDEIKALDVASPSVQREAYARLDALIRDHARQTTGIAVEALTPSELPCAMTHPKKVPGLEQIQSLLAECERAKYAPQLPDTERWSGVLLEAEQLLNV